MHIDFDQSLQQVSSNRTTKFQPEEKDWRLNKALDRFIKAKMKPRVDNRGVPTGGFEVNQLDADAIRSLIVSSYDLVPYIDPTTNRYRCFLPPDYSYLLSDWSHTINLCSGTPSVKTPLVIAETMNITALRQERSSAPSPKYYASVQVQLGGNVISIPNDLPYGNNYKGYDSVEDISFLRPMISKLGQWYWERFDGNYWPSYYIFASTSVQGLLPPQINVDSIITQKIITKSYTVNRHGGSGSYYDNRLSATDNISGMNSTEYVKTSYYSPISELSNGILYIYKDDSFIVTDVGISYIRKPQPMSLYLNTDCELPEEFHRIIVDLAVEDTQADLQSPQGFQTKVAENDRRLLI